MEVDEGLVVVARRLKKWRRLRGDEWTAERAKRQEEAEAEKRRASEERAATEKAAAEAEAEAAKAAEKRARLARARRIVKSEDEEDGEGVAAAAATTTATPTATATATPAATTTVADPAVVGEETGPTEGAVTEAGADEDGQDGVRTVWGTDGVTPIGVIKTGATGAKAGGRHVVVVVPPVLEHRVGARMTATPRSYSGWGEVEKRATEG